MITVGLAGPVAGATSDGSDEIHEPFEEWSSVEPGEQLDEETVEAFLEAWRPRVLNGERFQAYLDADGIPAEIEEEGFHDMEPAKQKQLAHELISSLVAHEDMQEELEGLSAEEQQAKLDSYARAAYLAIFNKEQLKSLATPGETQTSTSQSSPQAQLDERLQPVREDTISALETEPDLAPEHEERITETELARQIPDRLQSPQAERVEPTEVATDVSVPDRVELDDHTPEPLPEGPTPEPVPEPDLPIDTPVAELEAEEMLALSRNVIESATYNVCAISDSMDLTCSEPIPLGTPYSTDLDGDDVPDATATLRPDVDQDYPTGFSATFEVTRTDAANDGDLPGHVFAVFEGPSTFKRFQVGFDGTEDTLPDSGNLDFTLKDPGAAFQGDVQVQIDLETTTPGDELGVTFASKDLEATDIEGRAPGGAETGATVPGAGEPQPKNPLTGTFDFSPVPTNLTLDARVLDRDDDTRRMAFNLTQEQASTVDATLVSQDTEANSTRILTSTVDPLPAEVGISFETHGVGASTAHYEGSQKIDEFTFADKTIPDASNPNTYEKLAAVVHEIPTEIQFELSTGPQAEYQASDQLADAAVAIESVEDGELQTRMAGLAEQIPDRWSIAADDEGDDTTWTYDAAQRLGKAAFEFVDKTDTPIRAFVEANDLPTSMHLERRGEAVEFDAGDEAIGTVEAGFSKAGGPIAALSTDHAVLLERGDALGAHLKISGLSGFHMDPENGGQYAIDLQPGGQEFNALVDLNREQIATLHVASLPSTIEVDMTSGQNSFGYDADDRIPLVRATYEDRTKGLQALVELEGLPQTVDVSWTDTDPQDIRYEASGALDRIHAAYDSGSGTVFDVEVTEIPRVLEATAGEDLVEVTARSQPGAADGSGSVGQIHARMGTNGNLPAGTPSEDHAVLRSSGSLDQASVRYSGLADLEVTQNGDETNVHLDNSAQRLFVASVQTSDVSLDARVDKVPKTIDLTLRDNYVDYDASSPIADLQVNLQNSDGDYVDAHLEQITDSLTLDLRPGVREINWRMSSKPVCQAPVDPILLSSAGCGATNAYVDAQVTENRDTWEMSASVEEIPRSWDLKFPDGEVTFDANNGKIGTVEATITNHGSVRTLSGNHLSVVQNGPNLDASFRMTDIEHVSYQEVDDGFDTRLEMGGGNPFTVDAELNDLTQTTEAEIHVDPLPTRIEVSQRDDKMTYDASDNFDLRADAKVGHSAAVDNMPPVPSTRGLSVRDASGCSFFLGCGDAVGAHVFLEGFPTHLEIDPSSTTYSVDNFQPPATKTVCNFWSCYDVETDFLELDVLLDDVTSERVALWAKQNDIPNPADIQFGPIEQTDNGDVKRTDVHYEASGELGLFEAQARIGADFGDLLAELEISNIPSTVDVSMEFGEDTSTVSVDNSQKIDRIRLDAAAKTDTDQLPGPLNADATLQLTDIPKDVSLSFGEVSNNGNTLPGFDYSASDGTLDVLVDVSGTLFLDNGKVSARASLDVINFAESTTAQMDGSDLKVSSSGTTDRIEAHVSGGLDYSDGDSTCFPGCGSSFRAELDYSYSVDADVDDLWLRMQDVSSLTVKPGVMTEIDGNFGEVALGWEQIYIDASASASADVVVDLGIGSWSTNVVSLSAGINTNINIDFHTYRQTRHTWKSWNTGLVCDVSWGDTDYYHVELDLKPKYTGETSNAFSVGSHSVVLPDPGLLGDNAARAVAVLASPLDSGAWVDDSCY